MASSITQETLAPASSAKPTASLEPHDPESQELIPDNSTPAATSKTLLLGVYFSLNLFLTLSNKSILSQARIPWLLTASHASATSIGCYTMLGSGAIRLTPLSRTEELVIVAFSVLFTINIAVSNISLAMVSVPIHQIIRSTCPVITVILYRLIFGIAYSRKTYLTLIPVVLGVALSTAGDYHSTLTGVLVTFAGAAMASTKTIVTNRLMTASKKLSAPELLLRMSPLAVAQCVALALVSGEANILRERHFSGHFAFSLLINAIAGCLLNLASFQANKSGGALTMAVCGNVKQALTILLGIVLFHVQVGLTNAVGMAVTIAGGVWYGKVELERVQRR